MVENGAPVSRSWLDSLSTDELIKTADTYGIDVPVGLERIFIISEILEAANSEKPFSSEEIKENPSYSETVLLPKQYNISFIEVIIRDPLWVFAFWEIKGHDKEMYGNANDFNGYFLRVIPLNGEDSFTVSISADDNARYFGFAEHNEQTSDSYVIKLVAVRGETEHQIAVSAPFYLPKLSDNDLIAEISKNPLVRLSGAQDLSITKNTDRQSRVKRQ